MTPRSLKKQVFSFLIITLGAFVYALGFVWFYQPNSIAFGGVTGLAQIITYLIPVLPVGVTVIALNVPLFALGLWLLGVKMLVGSLYAMFISSVFIDLLNLRAWAPMDPMLACIFGGVTMGLSLGLIFQQGSTTGGTDLAARLLKLKLGWLPMGRLLLVIDLVVIVSVAAVFRSLSSAMYGGVAIYISSIVMDAVLYGTDTAKVAYIISDKEAEITHALVNDLDRGVTILHGEGGWSGDEKRVLMCAFKQRQIVELKRTVKEIDPSAFLIVCDAHEILGAGFRDYKKDDL